MLRVIILNSFSLLLGVTSVTYGQENLLSATGLYADIEAKTINEANRFYTPQYSLWTDGAIKRRWIYLPPGQTIRTEPETNAVLTDLNHWTFPVGTKLWKEFAFVSEATETRVETRLIEKISETEWEFSTYLWNASESEAVLAPGSGVVNHYPITSEVSHDIPGRAACMTCHSRGGDPILGFDALQLSTDRDPLGDVPRSVGASLDLSSLVEEGLLSAGSTPLETDPRIHSATPEGRASMGYMHANCGHCHNPEGNAGWTGLWLRHDVTAASEAEAPSFATVVNQLSLYFQIPGQSQSYRIKANAPEQSAILHRMEATDFSRMPPLGTKIVDEAASRTLRTWIHQLEE